MYLAFTYKLQFCGAVSILSQFSENSFNIIFIHVRFDVSEALSLALSLPAIF